MLTPQRLGLLVCFMMTLTAASAASYQFTCSMEKDHPVGVKSPNVYLMLDRSGSMNFASTDPSLSRWDAATAAISEVTKDMNTAGACAVDGDPTCDRIRFGIGSFSTGASHDLDVDEDSNVSSSFALDAVLTALSPPTGGTEINKGAEKIKDHTGLMATDRPNIAVLITDGGPSSSTCDSDDSKDVAIEAVRELCDARTRATAPVQTFAVGFGTDSSSDTNSLLAAAGGTGSCCLSSDCAANPVDPCGLSDSVLESHLDTYSPPMFCPIVELRSSLNCTGSIEATTPNDLKDALRDISSAALCTFALDIPTGYPGGAALSDPTATRVRIEHAYTTPGLIELDPVDPMAPMSNLHTDLVSGFGASTTDAAPYQDEGWYFSDSSRRFVRLTSQLCEDIKSTDLTAVKTTLACPCVKSGPCTITGGGWTPTELANMRCAAGEWQCVGGVDTCVPLGSDQPEICNGLDDDCDGIVDNMKDSWEKPAYSSKTLPADHLGVDCNRLNTCACPNGMKDNHAGTDWDTFLDEWDPVCQCGGGLEAPLHTPVSDGPAVHLDDQAACATGTLEDAAPFYLGFLIAAGLVTLRRRKL